MEGNRTETTSLLRRSLHHRDGVRSGRNRASASFCINSKAALLSLFWCFCIGILYGLASNPNVWIQRTVLKYTPLIYFANAISLCFYPLSGYLADNVVGRYKMIIGSLKLLIISVIVVVVPLTIFAALLVVHTMKSFDTNDYIQNAGQYGIIMVAVLLYLAMNIGFIGFNANVIQFGMEQLYDSPADHQSKFIYLYVWIYYLVQFIVVQPWNMLLLVQHNNIKVGDVLDGVAFSLLAVLGLASFAMITPSLLVAIQNKNWFLINPSRVNPYKLVYRITCFARQHKVPIRRSAFTYCEDEIPTGLDLAKTKYGGPFNTEEVENVKAFYGILKILLSLGPVFFLTYAADPALYWLIQSKYWKEFTFTSKNSYIYFLDGNNLSSIVVIVLVSFHLAILRKFRCCHCPNLLKRIGFGIIFLTFALISITIIKSSIYTDKQQCRFDLYLFNFTPYGEICLIDDIILPVLPRCLYGVSNFFLYPALYAFICAQSPSSMKGVLIGLSFAIKGIYEAIGAAFALMLLNFRFNTYMDLGYYGVNVLWAIFSLSLYSYFARRYKYRKRDEICDVYRYAEEYYSNTQEEENYD